MGSGVLHHRPDRRPVRVLRHRRGRRNDCPVPLLPLPGGRRPAGDRGRLRGPRHYWTVTPLRRHRPLDGGAVPRPDLPAAGPSLRAARLPAFPTPDPRGEPMPRRIRGLWLLTALLVAPGPALAQSVKRDESDTLHPPSNAKAASPDLDRAADLIIKQ